MNDVFAEILRLKQEGQRSALCTVISSKGSLPMSGKAKMLVGEDGTMVGTVGGVLAVEVGSAFGETIAEVMRGSFMNVRVAPDLAGRDRVVIARRP